MDRNVVEVNKQAQEERVRYPAIVTEQARLRTSFPADTVGTLGGKGLARWGSQSQSEILFTFPADGAIGGFHVTQISLFITQVKNKIVYHSIN